MKLTKSSKVTLAIAALLILTYIVIVWFLSLPGYTVLLTYLAYIVIAVIVFRVSLTAILGNYFHATGHTEKARNLLIRALNKNTKSPTAYLNYSILLVREGDGETALGYLKKAQSLNPKILTDKNIMLTMGSCYWVMGLIDEAIQVLEELRVKYEYVNSHALTTLGYMYFLKDDIDMALELTNMAIADSPQSGAAWDNLGQIHFKKHDYEQAKKAFENAVSYKEELVDSNYYLGLIAEEEGNFEQAQLYFNKAHNCKITALNTVTPEQIEEKYKKYS